MKCLVPDHLPVIGTGKLVDLPDPILVFDTNIGSRNGSCTDKTANSIATIHVRHESVLRRRDISSGDVSLFQRSCLVAARIAPYWIPGTICNQGSMHALHRYPNTPLVGAGEVNIGKKTRG